jgi:hypothetical protein
LQKYSLEECNCTNAWYHSIFQDWDNCLTLEQVECTNQIFANFNQTQIDTCINMYCPLECNRTTFSYESSSSEIIGDLYVDFIKSNKNLSADFVARPITAETAKKSFVYLFLAYDSLSYTYSNEYPNMDVVGLLAAIGGTFGLFMGVSLLSFCEIFEYILEVYFIRRETKFY